MPMSIKDRLSKVRFFTVKPDFSSLTVCERQALRHCVIASNIMTDIYLGQSFAESPRILNELLMRKDPEGKDLLAYFKIQGGPWDEYNHNEPFIPGVGEKPKFGTFYPHDLTKVEWEQHLNDRPRREEFESPVTVIRRYAPNTRKLDGFYARPYSVEHLDHLVRAAEHLREAVKLLSNGPLKKFLKGRAAAFLSNDYFESDCDWVDTDGNPFEVTIGPYETYFDELLGLKASFESFIALPDKDATAALSKFGPHVPDFDRVLAGEFGFKPKGAAIPLEVVADVHRGGEAGFGYGFVAYNLPNDRRVHEIKGSKKVFSRTMMQAKFATLSYPIAERVLSSRDLDHMQFNNRLLFVLGHELAHGLGPAMVKSGEREIPFETALGDLHSFLEEAKADMLGTRLLSHFHRRGLLTDNELAGAVVTEVCTFPQQWRHGYTEAHARGGLIEYNWLKKANAVKYDSASGTFDVHVERAIEAMEKLSTEFLNVQQAGDYANAKAFADEWAIIPPEAPAIVERLADLPKAVRAEYDLSDL